ncbi:family 20 glycosylhydrolase [Arthrobacter dokdonensis]|uniref:family 20 glycosylhydrolase n=1 Tax=Arthrobacter dokdonellae TaxID=2211210 RepID=UPI0014940CC0|nr:family 20 glycosylhydrolase [Arthrobacter dokdonellae]
MMSTRGIFPAPRLIKGTGGEPAGLLAQVFTQCDQSMRAQSYILSAKDGRIDLTHADEAGLRYGLSTLEQLRSGAMLCEEAFEIEDWPDFPVRGYMLDVSRDRVPTRAALRRLVAALSTARYNQLELYTEHTFAYREHPQVWDASSPLTEADVRWLDGVCASAGIALVANQNCLGHMERWLSHAKYAQRAESPNGMNLLSEVLPPTTLAPTDDNVEFTSALLDELVPLFRHKRLNIGADEPWELGMGVSKERAAAEGLGSVYADYVSAVMDPWIAQGYQVEYWADIVGHYPEAIEKLPPGAIPVVWMYNSGEMMKRLVALNDLEDEAVHAAHGIVLRDLVEGFRDRARSFISSKTPFWVAPGTNAWRSVTGRLDEALANLIDAAEVGIEYSSEGYLLTSWGNEGYWDPPVISLPPIAAGGAFSWALEANRSLSLPEVLNRHFFDDESGIVGEVLCSVGHIAELLDCPILNTTPLWVALSRGGDLPIGKIPPAHLMATARERLIQDQLRLISAQPACSDAELAVADLAFVIDMALFAIDLIGAGMSASGDPAPRDARQLMVRLSRLLERHQERWLANSRYGGLHASLAVLDPLRRRLERVASISAIHTLGRNNNG